MKSPSSVIKPEILTTAIRTKGIIENSSNGTVGQFDKRAIAATSTSSSASFTPYPSNEAVIEEKRVAAITTEFVASLPALWAQFSNASLLSSLYGIWPNPFKGYNASGSNLQKQNDLMLVDGSEVGQVNPIVPLIQPERNLDFIIVSDNSGSELSSGWMNGTNFIATATWAKGNNIPYPKIPDVNTMLNVSTLQLCGRRHMLTIFVTLSVEANGLPYILW